MGMYNDLAYSLREHLADNLDVNEVLTFYDGLNLDNKPKPFVVVESMFDDAEIIAAGRTDFDETYVFQIGVRAESERQLNTLKRDVTQELRKQITYFTTSGSSVTASGFFYVDVTRGEVVRPENLSRETNFHRYYVTAEINVIYDEEGGTFTP